jgi:tRNA(adenine34) deaminase
MGLPTNSDFNWAMGLALDEAHRAFSQDEVPIGAIILGPDGKVLARAHNEKEKDKDPTAHAEIVAIRRATKEVGDWRLCECTLVVTLEPCFMCMGAIAQARVKNLVFGAYDPKGGALSLGQKLYKDKGINHNFSVMGGVMHYECSQLLSQFFRLKRKK